MVTREHRTLVRRDLLRLLAAGGGVLAAGAPAAAPTTARSARATQANGMKLSIWGYNSFTPEGDELLAAQMQERRSNTFSRARRCRSGWRPRWKPRRRPTW